MKILKVVVVVVFVCVMFVLLVFFVGMEFKIYNKLDYVINGFYIVGSDGLFSNNWMNFEFNGNESVNMKFDYDGVCDIVFFVVWVVIDGFEIKGDLILIDICKVDNIYFDGKNVMYD